MDRSTQREICRLEPGSGRRRAGAAPLTLAMMAFLSLPGCDWIRLGWGAATYPTTANEPANVVALGHFAYATRGADGIEIVDLSAPKMRRVVTPVDDTTVDDLAIADRLLFALDARSPGGLAVYSLADPANPVLVQAPVMAEVGPFSGVSAANGLVAVSGGTSRLTLRRYTPEGRLGTELAVADLGRGQPDVLLAPDGRHAFVSVHDAGPRFSLGVLAIETSPLSLETVAKVPLDTYGFTPGGAKPANFPIEMALAGDRLLVASAAGLQIFDIANPATPRLRATIATAALPVNADAQGGIAAVVGSEPKPVLTLLDFANPDAAKPLATVELPAGSRATGVAVAGRHVVVAAHAAGTLVFDLDHLTQPGESNAHP